MWNIPRQNVGPRFGNPGAYPALLTWKWQRQVYENIWIALITILSSGNTASLITRRKYMHTLSMVAGFAAYAGLTEPFGFCGFWRTLTLG
jgi:hypothetical protein